MKVTSVSSKNICDNSWILKPNYHLNYGKKRIESAKKNNKHFVSLCDVVSDVYTGGIFKRMFVDSLKFGTPYISAQHMMNSDPLDVAKIISNKYTPRQDDMTLRANQILVSCAGTVGNIRLVDSDLSGIIGSQDIIRITPDEHKYPYGYIYAYLSTPTAYSYIQSFIYGSVVPRIEPKALSSLPVPILSEAKQQEIHNLIVEASSLHVEANNMLREAIECFDEFKIDYNYGSKRAEKISIKMLSKGNKRFDASNQVVANLVESSINDSYSKYIRINEIANDIFIGPRSKRNYVKTGVPFLSTSAMQKGNPTKVDKFINKKSSNGFIVSEGWILTTRSGTLGETTYVLPSLSGYAVSEDAIRIVVDNNAVISNKYLFAFLKSSIGKSSLLSGSYGSVILHLNEDYVGAIKVPILNKDKIDAIEKNIDIYISNMNEAILKENQAISLVEQEIELWQQ